MRTRKQAKKQPKTINRMALVVDSSGSMSSVVDEVVATFNDSVATIKEESKKYSQETTVTLVDFNDRVTETYFNADPATLKKLTRDQYRPGGSTALLDAVGHTIEKFKAMKDSDDDNVSYMITVVTDGQENASRRFDPGTLRALLKKMQATDRWSFSFLVPPGDKEALVRDYLVPAGNVREWEATTEGAREASRATQVGLRGYFNARSSGLKSVQTFYTDMSNVGVRQVRKLDDVSDKVKVWKVPAETDIKSFVETKSKAPYTRGAAYYALTKDELVQADKQVLIMEKGKTAVYGGDDARHLLGLPHEDVKVKPGNHSKYDIYVQSNSTNRKLVRGTNLLYMA